MPPASPTVAAWELGFRLREARELVGLSCTDAAKAVGVTQTYMNNVEHGRRKIAEDKLIKLFGPYQLEQDEQGELRSLREDADGRGWWWRYSGLFPVELLRFIGFEHGAEQIQTYEASLVSGLLQTESYARAVHRGDAANVRLSEVERRLEPRSHRQKRLTGPDPAQVVVVMTEAVLWQQVGGTGVLAEQLRHLLDLIEKHSDNLDLRIIPFTAGSYGAMGGSTFHLLTFPSARIPRMAWQETAVTMDLVHDQPRVQEYGASFSEALTYAADAEGSTTLVRKALEAIT